MSSTTHPPRSSALRWTDENLPLAMRRQLLAEEVKRVRAASPHPAAPIGTAAERPGREPRHKE